MQQNQGTFHILQLHLLNLYIKCVYWLDTHSVKVCWIHVLPNANSVHFCDIFFRHRTVLPTCQKSLENKKSDKQNRIRYILSKHFRLLRELMKALSSPQITITVKNGTFVSGSRNNSGNIGLLKNELKQVTGLKQMNKPMFLTKIKYFCLPILPNKWKHFLLFYFKFKLFQQMNKSSLWDILSSIYILKCGLLKTLMFKKSLEVLKF